LAENANNKHIKKMYEAFNQYIFSAKPNIATGSTPSGGTDSEEEDFNNGLNEETLDAIEIDEGAGIDEEAEIDEEAAGMDEEVEMDVDDEGPGTPHARSDPNE
jgi:hypothetical protein